jgi:hypothetical protein
MFLFSIQIRKKKNCDKSNKNKGQSIQKEAPTIDKPFKTPK